MREAFELRQGDRIVSARVALPEQTHIALLEQTALKKSGGEAGQQTHGNVHIARGHVFTQVPAVVSQGADLDAGCHMRQGVHQGGHEVNLANVGEAQGEGAFAGGRVKTVALVQGVLQCAQGITHRLHQVQGIRRGFHAACCAHKQLVFQQGAQALQGIADRGLRQAELVGGGGHTPVHQQLIENHQQVQVDVTQVHGSAFIHETNITYAV